MTAPIEIKPYPAPLWGSDEGGRCARCSGPCKRYGAGANPLCRDCFAEAAEKWGAAVRQKGYNA